MKFLKEHSYDIIRLYINQIGITIFSLVLYTSVSGLDDKTLSLRLQIAISVFAVLFFLALVYTVAWDWGANDIIRIEAGRQNLHIFKGAFISLIANTLNIILAAICVISMAFYMGGADGALGLSQVFNLILRLTNAMYIGIIKGIFSFVADDNMYNLLQSIGFLVLPALAIAATHIGYVMGLKNFKIFVSIKKKNSKH